MGADPAQLRRPPWPTAFEWWFPVALVLIALAAVLFLPDLRLGLGGASHRFRQSVQFALTSLAVIACTAAYLWSISRTTPLGWRWFAMALGFSALVVTVKFVLSPSAYRISGGESLADDVAVGLVVMVFYLLAPSLLFLVARGREASGPWSWPVRVLLFCAIVSLAVIARFVAVPIVGAPASEYLDHVFSGAGLILPVAIGLMAFLLIASFERAMTASQPSDFPGVTVTFTAASGLIVAYHALWIIFMQRTF